MLLLQPRRLIRPRGFKRVAAYAADGAADWSSRTSSLGMADGGKGTLNVWLRVDGGAGASRRFFNIATAGGSTRLNAFLHTTNGFIIQAVNSAATTLLDLRSALTNFTVSAAWRHILMSWDLSDSNKRHMLADGASTITVTTYTSGNIELSGAKSSVAADVGGSNKFTGALAEVFFHADYIDLSVAANIALFRTPDGRPADLGDDGSKPFGVQPAVYLRRAAGEAGVNDGAGGNFTVNGAYDDTDPPGV